jgi:hypothetical protein
MLTHKKLHLYILRNQFLHPNPLGRYNMPNISGETRAWLEHQIEYHNKQIIGFREKRKRRLDEIKRIVERTRLYNSKVKEIKKVVIGIEELLRTENWSA